MMAVEFNREDLYMVPGLGWCGPRYSEALQLQAEGYVLYERVTQQGRVFGYVARKPNSKRA